MGHNLDLVKMLGVPEKFTCEKCGAVNDTDFDDYDVECGEPNPSPGKWVLHRYCRECEHESAYEFEIKLTNVHVGDYE